MLTKQKEDFFTTTLPHILVPVLPTSLGGTILLGLFTGLVATAEAHAHRGPNYGTDISDFAFMCVLFWGFSFLADIAMIILSWCVFSHHTPIGKIITIVSTVLVFPGFCGSLLFGSVFGSALSR